MTTHLVPIELTGSSAKSQAGNSFISVKDITMSDGEQFLDHARQNAIHATYLHIPFCFHKCHYCDFYSIVDQHDRQEVFTTRLINEIMACACLFQSRLESIFVGGGTPTLLNVSQWERLLDSIHSFLPFDASTEFTVEANPETVTDELASVLAHGGVNRVSIGAQSFNPAHLKALERWHDPANVARSMECFRAAGITNLNLDLIFAIPGQTVEDWKDDLQRALELDPHHVSCYNLMYEPNTPLTQKMKTGVVQPVDQDVEADMYQTTVDLLSSAGFEHYEISNFSKPAKRCQHNLLYWENKNWWPFGPSASGHIAGVRWKNVPRLSEYLQNTPYPSITDVEQLDQSHRVGEELMLRFRLIEGVPVSYLNELLHSDGARRNTIDRHCENGLLEHVNGNIRFTREGLLLANVVLSDLV